MKLIKNNVLSILCDTITDMTSKNNQYEDLNKSIILSIHNSNANDQNSQSVYDIMRRIHKEIITNYKQNNMLNKIEKPSFGISYFNILKSSTCPPCKLFGAMIDSIYSKLEYNLNKDQFVMIWRTIFKTLASLKTGLINFYDDSDTTSINSSLMNVDKINDYIKNLSKNTSYDSIKTNLETITNNVSLYLPQIINIQMYFLDKSFALHDITINKTNLNDDIIDYSFDYENKLLLSESLGAILNDDELYNNVISYIIEGRNITKYIQNIINDKFSSYSDKVQNNALSMCARILHFGVYSTILSHLYNHIVMMANVAILNIDLNKEENRKFELQFDDEVEYIPFGIASFQGGENENIRTLFKNITKNHNGDLISALGINFSSTMSESARLNNVNKITMILKLLYMYSVDVNIHIFLNTMEKV